MDILALRSIVTSTNSIYCNLTIVSLFKEIVSSKFVYFSDGSDVLINFYTTSDEHDTVDRKDLSRANHGRFEVFVTDCYETESMTTKTMLQEIIYYEANPRSFLYEATFRELHFLLSNDQNFESDTSSRIISLHRKKTPEPRVRNYDVASIGLDKLDYHKNRIRDSKAKISFVLYVIWIFCREALHMLGLYVTIWIFSYLQIVLWELLFNFRATSVTLIGSIIKETRCLRKPWLEQVDQSLRQENISSTSSSEEYYTMIENASGNIALEYMSWSCDTESESENSTVDINCNRSRSVSCDNSKKDTEAANDLCIPVNISDILLGYPTSRFASKSPEKFPIANVEALSNCQQHKANSDICSEVALPTCSIEVAFLADWEHLLLTMPDTACTGDNNCTTSDSRTLSVCSSRDEKILPGQSLNNVSMIISQTNYAAQLDPGEWPACTSKNKKGFLEINDKSLDFSSSGKKESFAPLVRSSGATTHTGVTLIEGTIDDCTVTSECEAFPVNLSEERDSCLNKDTSLLVLKKFSSVDEDHGTLRYSSKTTIEIDVSMSPTSHRARQACLTPSEWQSVNDMPRVNRVPFTNQTQRITPLKEKARRNKSPGHNLSKMLLIDGSRIDENQNSGSSNSSTSSATFSDSKYGSKDRRFQIGESDNKLGPNDVSEAQAESPHLNSVPVSGEAIDSDLEETATCNYSDISSHDEKQIYDVIDSEAQSHEAVNTYESDIVDNTVQDIAAIVAQSGCHVSGRHRNRDSGSNSNDNRKSDGDSDSDSDNDLGQFYTPSPLLKSVDNMIASNPVVSSSSFGYISSYPSIGSSP